MSYYMKRKEELRQEAMNFFDEYLVISWGELQAWSDRLEKYAKRFGLLTEFRENGIL